MVSKVEGRKLSNNVYVCTEARAKLELLASEVGFKNKKIMSASAFVKFLIDEFGVEAKNKLLSDS